jgi:hypothetical protein
MRTLGAVNVRAEAAPVAAAPPAAAAAAAPDQATSVVPAVAPPAAGPAAAAAIKQLPAVGFSDLPGLGLAGPGAAVAAAPGIARTQQESADGSCGAAGQQGLAAVGWRVSLPFEGVVPLRWLQCVRLIL